MAFRILKWIAIITLVARFWRSPNFWLWIVGALIVSLTLHLLWRWKTKAWTQPWLGWDDVETANRD